MFMVMLVLDNPNLLDAVLGSWCEIGIRGATILESTGIHRYQTARKVHARYGIGLRALTDESANCTLLAMVPDEETASACLEATEKVVGDLDDPDTGVFAAWPLALTKGVPQVAAADCGKG
jgi:hypothetical protein